MTMEKRGIVDENTPAEVPQRPACCGGGCHASSTPQTKQAADAQEDHLTTRMADAAANVCRK